MTLIACTIIHKTPFLLGDLLLSSTEENKNFKSPTNPYNEHLLHALPRKPHSLCQKLYIIEDLLCIAFAGYEFEIIPYLKELKNRCNIYSEFGGIKRNHIEQFIKEQNLEEKFKLLGFFIILIDRIEGNSIDVAMFHFPKDVTKDKSLQQETWQKINTEFYGEVQAYGSGAEDFLELIKEKIDFKTGFDKENFYSVLQMNLILTARLLALEKINLYTLKQYWGAGFETAFFNGTKFQKIDEVCYVIMQGEFETAAGSFFLFLKSVIFYKYHEDDLIVISLEIENFTSKKEDTFVTLLSTKGNFQISSFIVPCILKETLESNSLDSFSFQTNQIAFGFAVSNENKKVFPGLFTISANVTYKENDFIELQIPNDMSEDVMKASRSYFGI